MLARKTTENKCRRRCPRTRHLSRHPCGNPPDGDLFGELKRQAGEGFILLFRLQFHFGEGGQATGVNVLLGERRVFFLPFKLIEQKAREQPPGLFLCGNCGRPMPTRALTTAPSEKPDCVPLDTSR